MNQTHEKLNKIQSILNEMQNNAIYIEQAFKHLEIDFISNEENKKEVVKCISNNLNSPDSFLNKISTKFKSTNQESDLIKEFTKFESEIRKKNEEEIQMVKNWWDNKLGKITNFEVLSWFKKEIYSFHFSINDLKIYITILLSAKKQSSLISELIDEINNEVDLSYSLIKSIYTSLLFWDLSGNGGSYIIVKFASLVLDVIYKNFLALINKLKNFLILKREKKEIRKLADKIAQKNKNDTKQLN